MLGPYLKYRFKSQGKFRLHSPFVYDFYEEVLDKITHENWKGELRNKLNLFLLSKKDVFKETDSFIIEEDVHVSKEKEIQWNEMINDKENLNNESIDILLEYGIITTLSSGCYHFGIIFKMERKEKQHFILRF